MCKKLPQIQWLKSTHIYYPTVSVGQESGHGSTQSSALQCLTKLRSMCQTGLQSHLKSQLGKNYFQVHLNDCWQDSVPQGLLHKSLSSSWLLAGDHPHFLPHESHQYCWLYQTQQERISQQESKLASKTEITILCKVIMEATYCGLAANS